MATVGIAGHWAIDAKALGGQDAGLALALAYLTAYSLYVSMVAAPLLVLTGLLMMAFHRDAGLRFLAAGALAALPLTMLLLKP